MKRLLILVVGILALGTASATDYDFKNPGQSALSRRRRLGKST